MSSATSTESIATYRKENGKLFKAKLAEEKLKEVMAKEFPQEYEAVFGAV